MKKIFLFLTICLLSVRLFAYDVFSVFALQDAYHTEYAAVEDSISTVLFAPSLGYYMSLNAFENESQTGFGISNTASICQTREFIFYDRILIGSSLRPPASFPIAFLSGIALQPEFEKASSSVSSFHFLIGFGFDFQLGTKKQGFGFGSALNVSLYPIMLANTTVNGETKEIKLEKYGRVCIGISFGVSSSN